MGRRPDRTVRPPASSSPERPAMRRRFFEIAFTPAVQALQSRHGSHELYERIADATPVDAGLSPRETAFLAARDSFYLATTSETGWPYIQHRGGPAGFVRVLDAR